MDEFEITVGCAVVPVGIFCNYSCILCTPEAAVFRSSFESIVYLGMLLPFATLRFATLFLLFCFFVFSDYVNAASIGEGVLSLMISAPTVNVTSLVELNVLATLKNVGNETLRILTHPQSVLSPLAAASSDSSSSDSSNSTFTPDSRKRSKRDGSDAGSMPPTRVFHISSVTTGAEPAFVGVLAKYAPGAVTLSGEGGGYDILGPGANVSVLHALGEWYDFRRSGGGRYNVTANSLFHAVQPDGKSVAVVQAMLQESHSVVVDIPGNLATSSQAASLGRRRLHQRNMIKTRQASPGRGGGSTGNFTSCSAGQQRTILDATVPVAERYAANAYVYLLSSRFGQDGGVNGSDPTDGVGSSEEGSKGGEDVPLANVDPLGVELGSEGDGNGGGLSSFGLFSGSSGPSAASLNDRRSARSLSHRQNANTNLTRPGGIQRYTTWFGELLQDRLQSPNAGQIQANTTNNGNATTAQAPALNRVRIVTGHFAAINATNFRAVNYDCSCQRQDVFAYVFPDQFGTIYLCGMFWNAPVNGTDSQAGTLIHESSHWTLNGATRDIVYGQEAAMELARYRPDQAVINADSHEYFAENSPYLD
ncbi:hypothetical protein D9613_008604 [Agrocybe pediades]|uniref:Lysine-specific metallo-endopeptidase domain-containing protein n=1 Tax=Agrocybe pediades TaxID=84607 RepID=A0A8H4QTR4_9AGAR|nr:hypothetical protein D9613_008604 [Agrocybe pediades]